MEEEDNSITMVDVLKEQEAFEEDAKAVLGASDDKNCTYSLGYVKRQALYACLTCCPESLTDPDCRAGVCLACSLACHENHNLVELYTKRNFRCDCGGPKFSHNCSFNPKRLEDNNENEYNQNFSGLYCICHRPYPDPDDTVEDEMIQCIICEDWFHSRHLNTNLPPTGQYSEMICEGCTDRNDFLEKYLCYEVSRNTSIEKTLEQQDVDIEKMSDGQSDIAKSTQDQVVENNIENENNLNKPQFENSNLIEVNAEGVDIEKISDGQNEIEKLSQDKIVENRVNGSQLENGNSEAENAESKVIENYIEKTAEVEQKSVGILHAESNVAIDLNDHASGQGLSENDTISDAIENEIETEQVDSSLYTPGTQIKDTSSNSLSLEMSDTMKDNLPLETGALILESNVNDTQEPHSNIESQINAACEVIRNNPDKSLEVESESEEQLSNIKPDIVVNSKHCGSDETLSESSVITESNSLSNVKGPHAIVDVSVSESEIVLENTENRADQELNQDIVSEELEEKNEDSFKCEATNVINEIIPEEICTESGTASATISNQFHDGEPNKNLTDEKNSQNPIYDNDLHMECNMKSSDVNNVESMDISDKIELAKVEDLDQPITSDTDNGDVQTAEQNIADILDDIDKCPGVLNSDEHMVVNDKEIIPIISETNDVNDVQEHNVSTVSDTTMSVDNGEQCGPLITSAQGTTELNYVSDAQGPYPSQKCESDDNNMADYISDVTSSQEREIVNNDFSETLHATESLNSNLEESTENNCKSVIPSNILPEDQSSNAQNTETSVNTNGVDNETSSEKQVQSNEVNKNVDAQTLSYDIEMKDQSEQEGRKTDESKNIENNSNTLDVDSAVFNCNEISAAKRKPDSEYMYGNESPMKKKIKQERIYITECIKPMHNDSYKRKGATFWPSDWRSKLCSCKSCLDIYDEKKVAFILDMADTVSAYEDLGKIKTESSSSQYEKGMEALSSLGHVQQINAITEYNKMKEKLLEFLKTFKDKKEVVKEEDIKGFFAGMKPKREPDGVYFCR